MDSVVIHSSSDVQTKQIGRSTRILQYVVILPGAFIGANCNIGPHCLVEDDVTVGDRVTIKSGVQLCNGMRIGNDVFIDVNVAFACEVLENGKRQQDGSAQTQVEAGVVIGANATILPGLTLGRNSVISAGAVLRRSVPPNAIVQGNPAQIIGYVNTGSSQTKHQSAEHIVPLPRQLCIDGATLLVLPKILDLRGTLTFGQIKDHLPFEPKRFFMVYDVPSREVRGEHAHKKLHQLLMCVRGSCAVMLDDGTHREEILLNSPTMALHIRPGIWGVQYKHTLDAALLVLCSDIYDPTDYIRDYNEFITWKKAEK